MTLKETFRYFENLDASSIHFKEFSRSPKDTYPTFTICLTEEDSDNWEAASIYSYQKNDIEHSLVYLNVFDSFTSFPKILKGEKVRIHNKTQKHTFNGTGGYVFEQLDSQEISVGLFNSLTVDIKELVHQVEFEAEKSNDSLKFDTDFLKDSNSLPFFLSYQDPEKVCFTRNDDDKPNIARLYDTVSLIKAKLEKFDPSVVLKLYIHYPGQLLRGLSTPVLETARRDLSYGKIQIFKISQVSILRKRTDSNIPCNDTLYDDDLQLRNEITKIAGCIPIYWNAIMPEDTNFNICKTAEDMQKINLILKNFTSIRALYQPPCNEMKLAFTNEEQNYFGANYLTITIRYMDKTYQEIVNERDFGFESFWSAVGGFIGIFVGASLSQVPLMMSEGWRILNRLTKNQKF